MLRPPLFHPPSLGENTEAIQQKLLNLDIQRIEELRNCGVFNPLETLIVNERTC